MRLLTSYFLASWVVEVIIFVIRWNGLCELWRASPKYLSLIVPPLALIIAPIVRPIAIAYQLYRRFLPKD